MFEYFIRKFNKETKVDKHEKLNILPEEKNILEISFNYLTREGLHMREMFLIT